MIRDYRKDPLKIVALCKTFRGEEFVEAMIESIYNEVEAIVFVNSNISWVGERGNTVKQVVESWCLKNDVAGKIFQIDFDSINQIDQYEFGFNCIKRDFKSDYVLLVDTDEIWDEGDINKCKIFIEKSEVEAYTINMRTYIKSPFYRLKNIEPCQPTVFVKSTCPQIIGVRGNGVHPRVNIPNIFMHHFSYVRKSEEEIIHKIKATTKSDGLQTIDIDKWKKEKWDLLPNPTVKNLHTSKGFEHYWESVEEITREELPKVFIKRNFPDLNIVQKEEIKRQEDLKVLNLEIWEKNRDSFQKEGFNKRILENTYCFIWDLYHIFEHCRKLNDNSSIVDLGSNMGAVIFCMNEAAKVTNKKFSIFSIEPFWQTPPEKEQTFKTNTKDIKFTLFRDFSNNVHKNIPNNSVDLIFIDGSHDYERVCEDICNYWPKLKLGGIMLGHDFDMGYIMYGERNPVNDGTVQAVFDKLRSKEVVKLERSAIFKVIKTKEEL